MAHQFILNVNSRDAYPQVLEVWNALMLQNDEEDINQAVAVVLQIEQMHENNLNDGSAADVNAAQEAADIASAQQGWEVQGANQYTGGFVTGGWDDDDNNGASNQQASNNGESITTNDGAVGEENIIRGMAKTTLEDATERDAIKADNDAPAFTGGTSSGKSDIRDYFRIAEDTQSPPATTTKSTSLASEILADPASPPSSPLRAHLSPQEQIKHTSSHPTNPPPQEADYSAELSILASQLRYLEAEYPSREIKQGGSSPTPTLPQATGHQGWPIPQPRISTSAFGAIKAPAAAAPKHKEPTPLSDFDFLQRYSTFDLALLKLHETRLSEWVGEYASSGSNNGNDSDDSGGRESSLPEEDIKKWREVVRTLIKGKGGRVTLDWWEEAKVMQEESRSERIAGGAGGGVAGLW